MWLTCAKCGKDYKRPPSKASRAVRHFCSPACYQATIGGVGNPNYSYAGIRVCLHCKKSYQNYSKARKYCSRECFLRSKGFSDIVESMKYNKGRKDANHAEVVGYFEDCGAFVLDISEVGRGVPDLAVWNGFEWLLVEIKNPKTDYGKAGLSKSQKKFVREWTGGPVYIARTQDDVILLLNQTRSGKGKPMLPKVVSVEQPVDALRAIGVI